MRVASYGVVMASSLCMHRECDTAAVARAGGDSVIAPLNTQEV